MGGVSFINIQNLVGGALDDTFSYAANGKVTGTQPAIDGGGGSNTLDYTNYGHAVTVNLQSQTATATAGYRHINTVLGHLGGATDTLVGANTPNTWNLTGLNQGSVDGLQFISFEILTGGSGSDTFVFGAGAGVSGKIDGAGGQNALDYSAYGSAVTVNLQTGTATATGGIAKIASLMGSSASDTLIGPNSASTWTLTGPNQLAPSRT